MSPRRRLVTKELERAESATWNEDKSRQTNGNLNFTHIFNEATNSEITVNMDYYHNADWTGNDQKTFTRNMGASGVDPFHKVHRLRQQGEHLVRES